VIVLLSIFCCRWFCKPDACWSTAVTRGRCILQCKSV